MHGEVMTFEKGEKIFILYDKGTVAGEVVLASPNSVSLMLKFEAMIGNHVGMMPVLQENKQLSTYRSIIDGTTVIVQKRELY